jgi:hypothetical protein
MTGRPSSDHMRRRIHDNHMRRRIHDFKALNDRGTFFASSKRVLRLSLGFHLGFSVGIGKRWRLIFFEACSYVCVQVCESECL